MTSHYFGEKRRAGGGLAMALLALTTATTATAQSVSIDFVSVGYAGNVADSNGLGSVNYEYQIGKFEVTNGQYAAFLNAAAKSDPYALYSEGMASNPQGGITRSGTAGSYSYTVKTGYENKPVTFVSWWDAARFANWAGTGDTEGSLPGAAYNLNNGFPAGVAREPNARVALPTQDEWYKAAYYQPANQLGPSGSYWLYPTKDNAVPTSAAPGAGLNQANFYRNDNIVNGVNGGYAVTQSLSYSNQTLLTNVGSYPDSGSFLGTFDQGGNVFEWNSTLFGPVSAGLRGGSWVPRGIDDLISSYGTTGALLHESDHIGFRVASLAPIPEPSTYASIAGLMSLGVAIWRRRNGHKITV